MASMFRHVINQFNTTAVYKLVRTTKAEKLSLNTSFNVKPLRMALRGSQAIFAYLTHEQLEAAHDGRPYDKQYHEHSEP